MIRCREMMLRRVVEILRINNREIIGLSGETLIIRGLRVTEGFLITILKRGQVQMSVRNTIIQRLMAMIASMNLRTLTKTIHLIQT